MTKADEQHARNERARAQMARYEADHDLVPGTCSYDGKEPRGGVEWEGLARSALARLPEHRNAADVDALARFPNPRSSCTGAPMVERTADELAAVRRHRAVLG